MTGPRSQVTDGYVSRSAAKQDIIYQKRAQHVRWQDSNGAYIKEASGYERDNLQQDVSVRSFLTYGFSGREKKNIDQRFIDNLSGPVVLSTPRKLRIRSDTWRRAKANY